MTSTYAYAPQWKRETVEHDMRNVFKFIEARGHTLYGIRGTPKQEEVKLVLAPP